MPSPVKWKPPDQRDAILAATLMLFSLLLYANSLDNDFVYDDVRLIRDNPILNHVWNLKSFFTQSYWAGISEYSGLYRPLTLWSFALDRALFGAGPMPVHAMNILLNGLLTAVLYLFCRQVFQTRTAALFCTLLFAAHPVHTEVVANGAGRAELGAGLFLLLALLAHLYAAVLPSTAPGNRRWITFSLAAFCYLLALLFKESAVLFPALALLLSLLWHKNPLNSLQHNWRAYVLYTGVLAVVLAWRFSIIGMQPPKPPELLAGTSWLLQRAHGCATFFQYLWQLCFPLELCADYRDYRHPIANRSFTPLTAAALLLWPLLIATAVWLHRRGERRILVWSAWFLLALLPAGNLILTIGTPRADRILFLPSLGFVAILTILILRTARCYPRLPRILFAALLLGYAIRTLARNRDWRTNRSLWLATVRANPGCAMAWRNLADLYMKNKQNNEARRLLKKAIKLRENAGFFYPESHIHLGHLYRADGKNKQAAREYRLVLQHQPDNVIARISLGQLLYLSPQTLTESIKILRQTTQIQPTSPHAWANLAEALYRAKNFSAALSACNRALKLAPKLEYIHKIREKILVQQRKQLSHD